MIDFEWTKDTKDDDIELAFDKKKADERKNWLANLDYANTFIDTTQGVIS